MKRPLYMKDLFELKCKKCGSTDTEISTEMWGCCGIQIVVECNKCKSKYDEHKFESIEVNE